MKHRTLFHSYRTVATVVDTEKENLRHLDREVAYLSIKKFGKEKRGIRPNWIKAILNKRREPYSWTDERLRPFTRESEYRNRQFQMPSDRSAIASWLCFNRFYSTGRNVIRLFYFARVVSSVEGREKVVRLKPDLYDLKWVRKCPFKNKKRIFTEKELRGLVSYCPILFFLLDERLPQQHWFVNLHGLSQSNLFLLLTPGASLNC